MIRKCQDLFGKPVLAVDGACGTLFDFYFNGRTWDIRHAVIDLAGVPEPRRVFISPLALSEFDGACLGAHLTKDEIADSPDEIDGIPPFPRNAGLAQTTVAAEHPFGNEDRHSGTADSLLLDTPSKRPYVVAQSQERLYSIRDVAGYSVFCENGKGGESRDMLIDDQLWMVRFIVFLPDGGNPRAHLLHTTMIDAIERRNTSIYVPFSSNLLRNCVYYDPERHVNVPNEKMPGLFSAAGRTIW